MRISRTPASPQPAHTSRIGRIRPAVAVSQIPENTEYQVFCGEITANDLLGAGEHGIVAAVSLPAAIKLVQSTTRHKARGYWYPTDDEVKVAAALAKPKTVLTTKDQYSRNPVYKPR